MRETKSPKFDSPPVVETILGVQFPALPFTAGHPGWFWKDYLPKEWCKAIDVPPLLDQFERFEEQNWTVPGTPFSLTFTLPRLQLTNEAGDRFVQLQTTRFIYNWQRKQNAYPSYDQSKEQFLKLFDQFCLFVADAGLGKVSPNQWEISYIDQIPKGPLWQSPSDWSRILPGFFSSALEVPGLKFENAGEWHYEIVPQKGRVHVALQHVRTGSITGPEALQIQWTARGPMTGEGNEGIVSALNLGHDMLLRSFLKMTSAEAQQAWGRRD
jgi:uncharacterized protein (TIGR04255 family)